MTTSPPGRPESNPESEVLDLGIEVLASRDMMAKEDCPAAEEVDGR